ncbi:disease resistance protein PIK6-NP-like, partial [Triticum dicoccoides]|uniref:disease resistance protein PIK6-NP-like n=1 Tax=Triticum dicoccoides TaxID=85692 RepID=UPI00188EFE04
MDAQGAVDSLLGRLTAILVDEAQLLGGLHCDVEFIKDEMESMNGLLLHLIEAHHRDHQVRAWMKQVVDLTRDCEGNVELYIHSVTDAGHHASGFLGYLRHIVRYVRTIPERHRIATRIQELKVRARDVGDRKLRYGVTVPPAADQADPIFMGDVPHGSEDEEEDAHRRSLLINCPDEVAYIEKIIDDIIKSLLAEEELVQDPANGDSHPRIFLIIPPRYDYLDMDMITKKLYKRKMCSFSCKALVHYGKQCFSEVHVLREILHHVAPLPAEQDMLRVELEKSSEISPSIDVEDETMQLRKKLEGYLKGKRFLIIVRGIDDKYDWKSIGPGLLHATAHGSPDSAIVFTRYSEDFFIESPYKKLKLQSLFSAFCNNTKELCSGSSGYGIRQILHLCQSDVFAMKMFQHLMYVNGARGTTQIDNFVGTLEGCELLGKSVAKQMVKFSYNDLPAKYRSCLLYLTIFPQGDHIRRSTVCRRWIAEGLITSRENHAEDEADSCFNALLSRSLIQPGEIDDMGKTKTCTLHHVVHQVITRIARDINFADTDLPPNLARHLSIHSRTEVQASHTDHALQAADGAGIVALLPYLAKSSQWQLMKVLDLEGCRGLKKQHLKIICKIILLKYLSLRNTDITELPKKIEKLQCLETLDIRQTTVRAFATKSVMLPMLKHLFAGQAESPSNITDRSQDLFTAVRLPSSIRRMNQLETLSHVEVSHSVNDLTGVGHLLQLRKLGVILQGKKGGLSYLFQQIEKLHGCLRSLSIQINEPVSQTEDTLSSEEVVTLASPPNLLQSLNISGITSGFLLWIAELDQLTKITLSQTYLGEDDICILGKLAALRCLRLRRSSYAGSGLTFKQEEFKILRSLVVDDGTITDIIFDTGAAPKLERIVWSFAKMESICGLLRLPKLKNVELNGDCDPDPVRLALEKHPNLPDFKHKPHQGQQED